MVKVCTHGMMEESMKGITNLIRNTASANIYGLMEGSMRVSGHMGSKINILTL